MTNTHARQPGDFCWVELCSENVEQAKQFYEPLFQWQSHTDPIPGGGSYTTMKLNGDAVAAAMQMTEEMKEQHIPPHWSCYILVNDVDQMTDKARELGATILKGPFDVMEEGRMSVIQDPTDAVICLWQAKKEPGVGLPKNVAGNFCWNELATNDVKKAGEFYSKLFNWQLNTKPLAEGIEYTSFMNGETSVGGMMQLTEEWNGAPPHWGVYFTVTNLDEALAKIKDLGGKVMYDPMDVPEVGRFTMIQDPEGAHFSIIQLPQ